VKAGEAVVQSAVGRAVSVEMDMPVSMSRQDATATLDSFSSTVDVDLNGIYDAARFIAQARLSRASR